MKNPLTRMLCVPDLGDAENCQAFLDLMEPEQRTVAVEWLERYKERHQVINQKSAAGAVLVSVPVSAGLWKSWCDTRCFDYDPDAVVTYATWLHLCTKV